MNKPKVIALKGYPNTGKTTTLKLVHKTLIKDFGYSQINGAYECFGSNNNDFKDVLQLDGFKIGIITEGDFATGKNSVENRFKSLEKYHCDLIVCACTLGESKNRILEFLESFAPKNVDIKPKMAEYNANRIIEAIMEIK